MREVIEYILEFLLYGRKDAVRLVGYEVEKEKSVKDESLRGEGEGLREKGEKDESLSGKKVVIRGSRRSPLNNVEATWADFYPEVREAVERRSFGDEVDMVSVACFFLSRAEELVVRERDEHGRFLARHSLLGEHNLLLMPLLDEYSRHLMKRLGLAVPEQGLRGVNLTHDVDVVTRYRSWRGAIGGVLRGHAGEVWRALRRVENDPAWTFGELMKMDGEVEGARVIYFLKSGGDGTYDIPVYDLRGRDGRRLLGMLGERGVEIGLHASYAAGGDGRLLRGEKEQLERVIGREVRANRHHYLRCTTIENMQQLVDAGIRDDYTMGFADRAGFRLLTSRPVRWINPQTLRLTDLTLHPLTVMDCTLSEGKYMGLSEEEAYYTCQQLIDKTRQNVGEVTLLWHNSNMTKETYHADLYKEVLRYLEQVR